LNVAILCVIFLLLLILSIKQPHYALITAWCMNGLDQLTTVSSPYFERNTSLINFVIASILGVAFVRSLFHRELVPWRSKGISLFLWLLMAYTGISLLWSPAQQKGIKYWVSQGIPYFILLMIFLPHVITNLRKTHDALRLVFLATLALVAFLAFGVKWELRGLAITPFYSSTGTLVTYTSPLSLGEFGSYLVVISGLIWTGRNNFWRILRALGIILGLIIAVKSGSRGQFFASLIVIILCTPFTIPLRKFFTPKTIIGLPILLVTLLVISSFVVTNESKFNQNRFDQDDMESSTMVRLDMCSRLIQSAWAKPLPMIFGLGNSASFHHEVVGFYPHMIAIEILGEEGLLGFVLFLGLLVCSGVVIVRLLLMDLPPQTASVCAVFIGILLLHLIISCKQGSLVTSPSLWSAFLMLERLYNIALRDRASELTAGEPTRI
jgi:O-antigen ligase